MSKLNPFLSLVTCLLMMTAVALRHSGKLCGITPGRPASAEPLVDSTDFIAIQEDGTAVIDTTTPGAPIHGYAGPTPLKIYLKDGRVQLIEALPNQDTPEFFSATAEDGFREQWYGKTVEQAAATAEGFHDGDRDMVGGAIVVELNTHGVDAGLEVVHGALVPRGGTTTKAVESGVEREHDDFNPAATCSHERHFGVVAADTNVLDFAFFLVLENIVEIGAALQFVPLFGAIGDVNHAHFDVVGAQTLEEVFETLLGFLEVAGAGVLPVLENGADMGLDNHAVAAAFEGCTDVGAGFGVGIVDVDVVDAAIQCHVHQGNGASRIEFFESTTAYADFTYREACVAQWAVGHGVLRGVLASHLHECERQKGKG